MRYHTSLPPPWNTAPGWATQTLERRAGGSLLELIVGLGRRVMGVEPGEHRVGREPQGSSFQPGNLDLERLEAHVLRTLLKGFSGLLKDVRKNFQAQGTRHQKLRVTNLGQLVALGPVAWAWEEARV